MADEDVSILFSSLKESEYYDMYGSMHLKLSVGLSATVAVVGLILYLFRDSLMPTTLAMIVCLTVAAAVFFAMAVFTSIYWSNYLLDRFENRELAFKAIVARCTESASSVGEPVGWRVGHFGSYVEAVLDGSVQQMAPILENILDEGSYELKKLT